MTTLEFAPVALFAFNRPHTFFNTVQALANNYNAKNTHLYIFLDGPRSNNSADHIAQQRILSLLPTTNSFKSVDLHHRSSNLGLKTNIVSGINELLAEYESLIVLEDDLLTSPFFLNFINDSLRQYQNVENVCQISGYSYLQYHPLMSSYESPYFLRGGDCLAWATWRRAWRYYSDDSESLYSQLRSLQLLYQFNRRNSYDYAGLLKANISSQKSWAINWYASTYLYKMYTLYPPQSFAIHSSSELEPGTNYKERTNDPLNVPLATNYYTYPTAPISDNPAIETAYRHFLKKTRPHSIFRRILGRIINRAKSIIKRKSWFLTVL